MASRKKVDLYRPLIDVWDYAEMRWDMEHPTLPRPFLTCTYRSETEQNDLYNQPWDKKDNDGDGKIDEKNEKVTNAKGGQSPHNIFPSMAFDVAFWDDNKKALDWSEHLFAKFWKLMCEKYEKQMTWGGNFASIPDRPHYEWKTWKDFKKKVR